MDLLVVLLSEWRGNPAPQPAELVRKRLRAETSGPRLDIQNVNHVVDIVRFHLVSFQGLRLPAPEVYALRLQFHRYDLRSAMH